MGIGEGIALTLAAQGADVALTDLDSDGPARVASKITDTRTMALELDVTAQESVDGVVARVLEEWGHLDILVNNAGVPSAPGGTAASGREVDWDMTFNVNVKGVLRCCNAVIPHMKGRRYGKIVNIGSQAGHASRRMGGAYAASKAAVLRYTKGLAVELAPFNINVNAVCPGAVWTRIHKKAIRDMPGVDLEMFERDPYRAFAQLFEKTIPLGRVQSVEDIGKAVAFLVSEDSCNITGQCLHVDGGNILRD